MAKMHLVCVHAALRIGAEGWKAPVAGHRKRGGKIRRVKNGPKHDPDGRYIHPWYLDGATRSLSEGKLYKSALRYQKGKPMTWLRLSIRFLLIGLPIISGPAYSQDRRQHTQECLIALNEGNSSRAQELAADIMTWEGLNSSQIRREGRECLEGATEEAWVYNMQIEKFILRGAAAAIRQTEEVRQEVVLDRKCELEDEIFDLYQQLETNEAILNELITTYQADALSEVVRECQDWYVESRRESITNEVCNSIFLEYGLPNSQVSETVDQARFAATEAASRLALLEAELDIIKQHDMLLQDYFEQLVTPPDSDEVALNECDERND